MSRVGDSWRNLSGLGKAGVVAGGVVVLGIIGSLGGAGDEDTAAQNTSVATTVTSEATTTTGVTTAEATTTTTKATPTSTAATTTTAASTTSAEATTTTATTVESADAVIVTVHYDADGNDNENKNGEWVEIENQGVWTADLSGWRIEDEGPNHTYRFPDGFMLEPSGTVLLFSGCGTDSAAELYWCNQGSAVWNNDGDTASLFDGDGVLVDSWGY
jgi:hypothetical protein